jgi:hypothetical protein
MSSILLNSTFICVLTELSEDQLQRKHEQKKETKQAYTQKQKKNKATLSFRQ